jgi:hypothetical protein
MSGLRVLPDSKDLINVIDYATPLSVEDLAKVLTSNGHRLVFTSINVKEALGPVRKTGDIDRMCGRYRALDSLPHCALAESFILHQEIEAAVKAFHAGQTSPASISPFVFHWLDTLTPPHCIAPNVNEHVKMDAERFLIGMLRESPQFFDPHAREHTVLQTLLLDNREAQPRKRRSAARVLFRGQLKHHIEQMRLPVITELNDLGDWLFDNPCFCPSLTFGFMLYQEFVDNLTDRMQRGDIHDVNLLLCLPYVDAITVDRRMLDYARRALVKVPDLQHYQTRMFDNLGHWISRHCS